MLRSQRSENIGNLTLAHWADNSSLSNKPFIEKLTVAQGYKQSALRLNEYIVEQTQWGENQINERAGKLAELAKRIWPYPTLSDSELEPYQKQDDSVTQYSLDSYDQLNAYNKILFEKLNTLILNFGAEIKREFTKTYVSYKVNTIFVAVFIQKDRLFQSDFDKLIDGIRNEE